MDKEMIIATKFGKRVSELYIDPISAITLRDGMFQAQKKTTINFSLLHLLSSVTEMGRLYLRKKDYDGCVKEAYQNEKYFLVEMPNQLAEPWIFEDFLTQVKSSMFFQDWINEKNEDYLFNKYNLGQGDIRVKVNLADWILYSAYEIGLLFKFSKLKDILILRNRIRYGVKDNILDLVSLRNIGRARARKLYNADYKTLSDLKIAREEDLARVPLVGRKIAESIKKQLG